MSYIKRTNFGLGEISPENAFKLEFLESGAALKHADRVVITPSASISNSPGTLIITKSEDFRNVLESFSFTFNRYQSYNCLVLPNEDSGLTKLRIYDNIGTLITEEDINLPYAPDDVQNVNGYQMNDVMFFYCEGYNIMMLKRVSATEFRFDTFNVNSFKNLIRSATGLYIYYNTVDTRWEISASSNFFNINQIGQVLYIAQNFNSSINSFETTLLEYTSGTIFAKSVAFTITCVNNTDISIEQSSNGIDFVKIYDTHIPAAGTGNYIYSDDGNAYFFRVTIKQSTNGKVNVNYAVSAFTFYHECNIAQILDEFKAVVSVNYNTTAYQDIFISSSSSKEVIDLVTPSNPYGSVTKFANVENDDSLENYNIFGREDTSSSIKSLFKTNFRRPVGMEDPIFRYTYTFTNVKSLNRFRVKGLIRIEAVIQSLTVILKCSGRYSLVATRNDNTEFILKTNTFSHSEEGHIESTGTYGKNLSIDIMAENLSYQNIKTIEFRLYMDSWTSTGWRGAPRRIELHTFRAQGSEYISSDDGIKRYSYYYGFANDMKPNTGCIYQNRHIIAGTSTLASYIAAYDNFNNLETDMLADEMPFIINKNTRGYGKTLRLVPFREGILSLGTDQEIFYYAEGAFTPSTRAQKIMGERGNENIKPCIVEYGFLGVERGGDLYFQSFELASESYTRKSLRKYAEHLFKGKTIKKIETLMSSDKTVFILFTDGTMIRMYLDIASGIIAFMRFTINGHISTMSVVDNINEKELWIVIDDKMMKVCSARDLHQCTLDFAVKFENVTEFTVPEHLTGDDRFVVCYDAKGMWRETIQVAAGEVHKLSRKAVTAYAGIGYEPNFEMLDFGAFNADYSAQRGRVDKAEICLVDSYGLEIEGAQMDQEVDEQGYLKLLTGKYPDISLNSARGEEKQVRVKGGYGYPFTVAGLALRAAK